jgi:hypothetical protein
VTFSHEIELRLDGVSPCHAKVRISASPGLALPQAKSNRAQHQRVEEQFHQGRLTRNVAYATSKCRALEQLILQVEPARRSNLV